MTDAHCIYYSDTAAHHRLFDTLVTPLQTVVKVMARLS